MSPKNIPLVSVIMNCYNGEKYLKKSLKSVLLQSYKNWEIIFWDNLSTDNTFKIVNSIKEKKIKYYKSKFFLNLYEARNLAIKKAKGKYISFLDTDDTWEKDKLKHQVKFSEKNKNFFIQYSNFFIENEIKKKNYIRYKKNLTSGKITQNLLNNYSMGLLTVFLNKSLFKKYKFNDKYNIIGDFDFFIKLSQKYKIAYNKKPLATYRIHKSNYHTSNLNQYISELQNWINKNNIVFKNKNYSLLSLKYFLFKIKVNLFIKRFLGM